MRDTGIADRLRAKGLKVVEIAGWKTRGVDTFSPRGSVDHHTAGSATGNAPSLGICINGRSDLPGPLCHVLVGRDNTCYVIAAGRANHAGSGGWAGLSGNSSVYGVERENVGYPNREPWRPDQTDAAARVHAALIGPSGDPSKVCLHREWAPSRKIDAHTISGADLRTLVAKYLKVLDPDPTPPVTPPVKKEEVDMNIPALIIKSDDPADSRWYVTDTITRQWVQNRQHAAILISQGAAKPQAGTGDMNKTAEIVPFTWPAAAVKSIRLVE